MYAEERQQAILHKARVDGRVDVVVPAGAAVKPAMVGAARRIVLPTDHAKVGHDCMARFGGLDDVDLFVTDTGLDEETAADFGGAGVRVVRA